MMKIFCNVDRLITMSGKEPSARYSVHLVTSFEILVFTFFVSDTLKLYYMFSEQMNVDITESREELESQCSRLHGNV